MNNEFENRLRDGLAEQSDAIEIEGAGPSAAAARAADRQRQTGLGRGLAAMVVVACLGALAFTQFSDNGTEDFIATEELEDESAEVTSGNGAGEVAVADFESEVFDGGTGFGAFLTDDGQLIQITTQPGLEWEDYPEDGPPMVVLVSDKDGVIETNKIDQSNYAPVSTAYFDGVLYTVTTSPRSVNDGNDLVLQSSTDYGKSWTSQSVEMPAVPNPEVVDVWRDSRVSVNSSGVLITVQSGYWANFAKLLPQYSYEKGNFEILQVETGVEVRDWSDYQEASDARAQICDRILEGVEEPTDEDFAEMEDCWAEMEELPRPEVLESFTWDELGIEPFSQQGDSSAFFASDGTNFEPVALPEGNFSNYVLSTRSGFMTQVYPDYPESEYGYAEEPLHDGLEEAYMPTWIASTDGKTWNEVSVPAGVCNITGSPGDLFLGQVCDESGKTYVSSDNGNSWEALGPVPSDAPEGYVTYSNVYAGDLGFIAFRNTEPDYRLYEGEEFDDPVVTTVPDSAPAIDGLAEDEIQQEENEEFDTEVHDEAELYDESNRSLDVFFSADGQTWSRIDLPLESEGQMVWGNGALVGSNEIVLTIGSADDDAYRVRQIFLSPS